MTKQQAAADALASMVDELGELESEIAPYKAKLKRADALRSAIRGNFASHLAESSFALDGERFTALLGPKGNESIVDRTLLYKLAGPKKYIEASSVSLKAIEEVCDLATLGAVVTILQSGSRSLSVVPKA